VLGLFLDSVGCGCSLFTVIPYKTANFLALYVGMAVLKLPHGCLQSGVCLMWDMHFSQHIQHDAMLKGAGCEYESMNRLIFSPQ
jgi:hypothetical protein